MVDKIQTEQFFVELNAKMLSTDKKHLARPLKNVKFVQRSIWYFYQKSTLVNFAQGHAQTSPR